MCYITSSGGSDSVKNCRLPKTVVPSRYEIKLIPDLDKFVFSGEVKIAVTVHTPVSKIVLNAKELEIQEASAACALTGTILTGSTTLDAENEQATIAFAGTLGVGEW